MHPDEEELMGQRTHFKSHLDDLTPNWLKEKESTGTSIMAVEFDGGVVCGADSRSTMGSFVGNRFSDKLTRVTDHIYCLRSGSSADTQCVRDVVAYHLNFYEMETNEPPQVSTAANVFRNMCYNYRDQLSASIIVAGWDKRYGGQVYTVPLGGMLLRQPVSIGGSGSTYIYGFVDSNYKENMSKDQCIKFVTEALSLAIARDGSSGGVVRLAIITKDGVERRCVLGNELPRFYEG